MKLHEQLFTPPMLRLNILLIVLIPFLLLSCSRQEQRPTDLVTFPLRGKIVAIDTARHRVMIAHHEIPNYMMAMTMPFRVKDNALMQGVQPGDSIVATLAVSREESWLETVKVIQKGEQVEPMSPEAIKLKHLFQPGEALPDDALLNQDGKTIRLGDYKGKVLALTFIYTRCPLPDFCIRMSNHFARVQQALSNDKSLDGKWHLFSISFDPKFDSPKVLKTYGKTYKADFATWEFATDPDTSGKAIMRLADGLDLTYAEDEGLIQHNLRTVLIDKEGKLVKVIDGNEWLPDDVAKEVARLAQ